MSYNKLTRDWELPSFQETRNRWAIINWLENESFLVFKKLEIDEL